jgi:TRAP transporter 4TM/12TM fusion protein
VTVLGALWALEVHHYLPWTFFREQYLGLFLGLALAAVFLGVKVREREAGSSVPWFDGVLALAGFAVGGYVAVLYPRIAYQLGFVTWDKVALGALAIGLVLEATRRLAGWPLVWVAVACLLYAKFAHLLPGVFHGKGAPWGRLPTYLYLDSNGLLGLPLVVAATIVAAFVLFGRALYAVGGDRFLTDVALVAMGRFRGGPAKVAVVSSSLFGTVSGSAVANVVLDGAITIPMMKRAGYPPHVAAAIEAVASNGGQIAPPVMGAASFLIAEFLGIPYGEVVLAALVPACLYYLALFVQVDLEAAKLGLAGLPREQLPRLSEVLGRGWVFVVPLLVLLYTLMVANWEAGKAGMAAVFATLAVGALRAETRPTGRALLATLTETGRTLLDIVIVTALAGLVIGALQLSGLSARLPLMLLTLAGGQILLLLLLTGVVCIVLGMSLPTTVVYVTLAVVVGPALTQLGIVPIAAHLFLFYFGMLSLITPPDCVATYAAAAIARADFWRAGWTGMRLGVVAYVVPFVFALHPALLLRGTAGEIVLALVASTIGVIGLGVGCAGYLFRPLGWGKRSAVLAVGLLFLALPPGVGSLLGYGAALVFTGLFLAWEWSGTARVAARRGV